MANDLSGRVALITGARRGIGAAIAQRLVAAGASVIITAQTAQDEGLEETIDSLNAHGRKAASLVFDLADGPARVGAVERAAEAFGPIDILVNNAATNNYAPPSAMDCAFRRVMFEVNVHGPVDLIQQALPYMKGQGWGRIVNVTSASRAQAELPYSPSHSGIVVYGASKLAMERFTTGLAAELSGTGITVNSYYPTAVCFTGTNSAAALTALRRQPGLAEGVEMMAEAAMLLIRSPMTGMALPSRDILHLMQSPLHALDGETVIGDANTLADIGTDLGA